MRLREDERGRAAREPARLLPCLCTTECDNEGVYCTGGEVRRV